MKKIIITLLTFCFGIVCALAMGNGIQPWIPVQPAFIQPVPVPGTPTPAPTLAPATTPGMIFVPIQPTPTIYMVPRTNRVYVPTHGRQRTGGMRSWIFGDVIRW